MFTVVGCSCLLRCVMGDVVRNITGVGVHLGDNRGVSGLSRGRCIGSGSMGAQEEWLQ